MGLSPVRRQPLPAGSEVPTVRKEGPSMTLKEMSKEYRAAAVPLRNRLRQLRQAMAASEDPEEIWQLQRRIRELAPLLSQVNELAELTERYYEKGYYRNKKYSL